MAIGRKGVFMQGSSEPPTVIDVDVNSQTFLVGITTDADIPVVNSEDTPLGSNDFPYWRIPDTDYDIYVGGVLQASFSVPTLKNEVINIIWT